MKPRHDTLTHARLLEVLAYEPATGIFRWKVRPTKWCRRKPGDLAGGVRGCGYHSISIDGTSYLSHRLAWMYMTGESPGEFNIDHKNRNPLDNRFENLRVGTVSQNAANRSAHAGNKSGLKGAHWETKTQKWRSSIEVNGKFHGLGRFDCPAAAHFAYVVAADKFFGEFARAA